MRQIIYFTPIVLLFLSFPYLVHYHILDRAATGIGKRDENNGVR